MMRRFALIGKGRAGGSLHDALMDLGWECGAVYGRGDDISAAATGVDVCIIATPDDQVAGVASQIEPGAAVVMHVSGALSLDVLAPHQAAGLHPLVSLANASLGAKQLRSAWFGVAGHEISVEIASELSGRHFSIADADRAVYHATAAIASNHLVALLGQVERLAASVGIPFEVFLPLIHGSLGNVGNLGPKAALTGPAARGDLGTIEKHRAALAENHPDELAAYDCLVDLATRLAGQSDH